MVQIELLKRKLERQDIELKKKDKLIRNTMRTIEQQKLEITQAHNERRQMREKLEAAMKQKNADVQELVIIEVNRVLGTVFTTGQIRKLLTEKNIHWSAEDISFAIALQGTSAKSYRYLRKNNYPLPSVSTLKRWAGKISCEPGVLTHVLSLMKNKASVMKETEKLCVLTADEMMLSRKVCYDASTDKVIGPFKQAQVIMARGLIGNWKQPVYYNFDTPITKNILDDVISQLYSASFTVVALTTDLGGGNQSFLKELDIHTENVMFPHPVTSAPIYYFADPPHLLKLIRNHFLDQGFTLETLEGEKVHINKDPLIELHKLVQEDYKKPEERRDIKIAYKMDDIHFACIRNDRQRVILAVQMFSHTNHKGLEFTGTRGMLTCDNWQPVSEFVKLMNDWFDLFNTRMKFHDTRPMKKGFGVELEEQKKLLNYMMDVMYNIRASGHNSMLPCQKGIIMACKSLINLHEHLTTLFPDEIVYILTYRLNQDVLEIFFSVIRSIGLTYNNPVPLEFKYRMRKYLLTRNPHLILNTCNVQIDTTSNIRIDEFEVERLNNDNETETLTNFDPPPNDNENLEEKVEENEDHLSEEEAIQFPVSQEEEIDIEYDYIVLVDTQGTDNFDTTEEESRNDDVIYQSGLLGIAGYIAHKLKNKFTYLAREDLAVMNPKSLPDWVDTLSEGGLTHPSAEFMEQVHVMDQLFNDHHGNGLNHNPECVKSLCGKIKSILTNCDDIVIKRFVRARLFLRIRHVNRLLRKNRKFDTRSWQSKKNIYNG